jgi:hypothetical protein
MENIQATIEQACEAFKVILDLQPGVSPRGCSQQCTCLCRTANS